ncbi:hypothetical protein T265_03206 [Opisthorchis viverrini]|uniref:Uncharacterized protein n=1 Tax=Opisthorchis viverrini TaxID=6198 RepID=A0A074ZTC2_OPIVI|nr:hypothetical protein T265_03206 [Opisthorchis viverrini]KER30371.1 hypothetical protein T265_03206 [Opisthorchis viverrini]
MCPSVGECSATYAGRLKRCLSIIILQSGGCSPKEPSPKARAPSVDCYGYGAVNSNSLLQKKLLAFWYVDVSGDIYSSILGIETALLSITSSTRNVGVVEFRVYSLRLLHILKREVHQTAIASVVATTAVNKLLF